jgi:hypothetical protein
MPPRSRATLAAFLTARGGAAAAEFALVLGLLAIPVLNIVDLGIYAYQRMELDNAGQAAAQAAWAIVPTCTLPVTVAGNCPSLAGTINTAIQSTSLGTAVTKSYAENYYCVSASTNQLVVVGSFPDTRPNCSDGLPAGDYLLVTASHAYTPLFTGISVVTLLASPITSTAWMRLS